MPGANEHMFTKALETRADALVLDLEDAVTPDNKISARRTVSDWLASADFGYQERIVRMNPLDSAWGTADLEVTMQHPPDAYMVPKVSTLQELTAIDALLTRLEQPHAATSRQTSSGMPMSFSATRVRYLTFSCRSTAVNASIAVAFDSSPQSRARNPGIIRTTLATDSATSR